MNNNKVDIQADFNSLAPVIRKKIIMDMTTNENVLGADFKPISDNCVLIPRSLKQKDQALKRTKEKAEVYTPFHIVSSMVDVIDSEMVGIRYCFEAYIDSSVLEITCGEGAFLTTRYEANTGCMISINQRAGILDRKLMRLNEHDVTEKTWQNYALRIAKSIYGYEYQADSLVIARLNVLHAFIDAYADKFHEAISDESIEDISSVIVWNIFQMDGLTHCIPQADILVHPKTKERSAPNGIPVKIMNWKEGKIELFRDGLK